MSAPPSLEVFLHNRVGRKGVPMRRSFERWIRAALRGRHVGRATIAVALLDEADARALNRQFRGRDYATNVLSFPHETIDGFVPRPPPEQKPISTPMPHVLARPPEPDKNTMRLGAKLPSRRRRR